MLAKSSQYLTSLEVAHFFYFRLFILIHLVVLESLFAFTSLKESPSLCSKVFITGHPHTPGNPQFAAF